MIEMLPAIHGSGKLFFNKWSHLVMGWKMSIDRSKQDKKYAILFVGYDHLPCRCIRGVFTSPHDGNGVFIIRKKFSNSMKEDNNIIFIKMKEKTDNTPFKYIEHHYVYDALNTLDLPKNVNPARGLIFAKHDVDKINGFWFGNIQWDFGEASSVIENEDEITIKLKHYHYQSKTLYKIKEKPESIVFNTMKLPDLPKN